MPNQPMMLIYLDFDGTVVEHQYPLIGKYNDGCLEVIDKLYRVGHEIIINTTRVELDKALLMEAVDYIHSALELLTGNPINYSLPYTDSKHHPSKWDWDLHFKTNRIFIDDICEGIPLKNGISGNRPMVDWKKLNSEFEAHGMYDS